jgi:anti-sigma-K factor RskA
MSTDVHTLSGAYALDALSPEEAAEFRRHLEGCQACCDEVRELRAAAALMGAAEATAPPPELRAKVLAAADRTPQMPPLRSSRRRGGRPATHRWTTWVASAAAAVVLVGGGAVGLRAALEDDPTRPQPTLSAAALEVFDAPDARTATVLTVNGGKLKVGVSPSHGEMAVDTRGLPALDKRHVYQIWAVHGRRMVSAAVLADPTAGAAMALPPARTEVALTVEPRGGSKQPTTKPIAQVDPRAV